MFRIDMWSLAGRTLTLRKWLFMEMKDKIFAITLSSKGRTACENGMNTYMYRRSYTEKLLRKGNVSKNSASKDDNHTISSLRLLCALCYKLKH